MTGADDGVNRVKPPSGGKPPEGVEQDSTTSAAGVGGDSDEGVGVGGGEAPETVPEFQWGDFQMAVSENKTSQLLINWLPRSAGDHTSNLKGKISEYLAAKGVTGISFSEALILLFQGCLIKNGIKEAVVQASLIYQHTHSFGVVYVVGDECFNAPEISAFYDLLVCHKQIDSKNLEKIRKVVSKQAARPKSVKQDKK